MQKQNNFEWAIDRLKEGLKVRQHWWVNKKAYVYLTDTGTLLDEQDNFTQIELANLTTEQPRAFAKHPAFLAWARSTVHPA